MAVEPNKIIFSMVRVSKFYDKRPVLKDISLGFYYGAKIGVLGLNGSGKSSLLRIIAGADKEYNGEIVSTPGISFGFLEQEPKLDPAKTVRQCVEEGVADVVALVKEYEEINAKFAEPMDDDAMNALIERQGEVQSKLDDHGAWDLDARLEMAMDALGCPVGDTPVANLSGGERRRVALCRLLLQKPDVLLLDEPTNHLDAETVGWLEHHLQAYEGTVIAVTHDRYFLDNVAGWILELDRGEGIPWKGNYSSWLEQKEKRLEKEQKAQDARTKTLQHELEWIRMSPKGRHAKGKARITAYEQLLGQDAEKRIDELEIYIPPGPRLGDVVIEAQRGAQGVRRHAADGQPDLQPAARRHRRRDRPQRRGQDDAVPDDHRPGQARRRDVPPRRDGEAGLRRPVARRPRPDQGALGGHLRRARHDPARQAQRERARLRRALQLLGLATSRSASTSSPAASATACTWRGSSRQEANVLLLDEPTNDLDVNTLRALEEALENFAGCAVVISHDRWFLDRIATHMLAFEGDSQVVFFDGNYSEYEADKKRRLGAAAETPHRIKYRKLTR